MCPKTPSMCPTWSTSSRARPPTRHNLLASSHRVTTKKLPVHACTPKNPRFHKPYISQIICNIEKVTWLKSRILITKVCSLLIIYYEGTFVHMTVHFILLSFEIQKNGFRTWSGEGERLDRDKLAPSDQRKIA